MHREDAHKNNQLIQCPWDLDDLLRYVNGLMSEAETKRLCEHMQSCRICRETVMSAKTEDSAREWINDMSDDDPEYCVPDFPLELQWKIRKEWIRRRCENGVNHTRDQLAALIETVAGTGLTHPAYSTVRSNSSGDIQIDILNLTDYPLDESRLEPVEDGDAWSLTGFPEAFCDVRAWVILIPITELRSLIPNWNRADSQNQLMGFLRESPDQQTLPGTAALNAAFVSAGDDGVRLDFRVTQDCLRLMRETDKVATAIILI